MHDSTRERWLVTGACGLLGTSITSRLAQPVTAVCRGSHGPACAGNELVDLRDRGSVTQLLNRVRPTHIVHLAGVTSVGGARLHPHQAWLLNASLTEQLAAYAVDHDAWLMYPSSDFVFDGRIGRPYIEDDDPGPVNLYGRTKRAGEKAVIDAHAGAVVRLSLLYELEGEGRSTLARLLARMGEGQIVDAVVDEVRTPLLVGDAAASIVALGRLRFAGLMHLGGPDAITPAGLLTALATNLGFPVRLNHISRADLDDDRPADTSLDHRRHRAVLPDLTIHAVPRLRSVIDLRTTKARA